MLKKSVLLLGCLVFQSTVYAETIFTTVFNVFESIKTERLLVLSGVDGRVYKTFKTEANVERMKSLVGKVVRLDYSLQGREAIITNIQVALPGEVDEKTWDLNHFRYNQLREFAPTELQSLERAKDIFNNMLNDGDKGRSQCFKRAHMWAFDMWSKLNINSEKIFIFYTKRYAALEDFEWWFHVAPVVNVAGEDYVMDGTFMEKPITIKEWLTYFIRTDKITCPLIDKYQDFEDHQWQRLCYHIKVPMYYFRPLDIENRDKNGAQRNHWVLEELQDARKAFRNWEENYEGLDTGKSTKKF